MTSYKPQARARARSWCVLLLLLRSFASACCSPVPQRQHATTHGRVPCMQVLPMGEEKKPQKVAAGDLTGVTQCFSVKKGEIQLAFKTLPSSYKVHAGEEACQVACMVLAQAVGLRTLAVCRRACGCCTAALQP